MTRRLSAAAQSLNQVMSSQLIDKDSSTRPREALPHMLFRCVSGGKNFTTSPSAHTSQDLVAVPYRCRRPISLSLSYIAVAAPVAVD